MMTAHTTWRSLTCRPRTGRSGRAALGVGFATAVILAMASCAPGTDGIVITSAEFEEPTEQLIQDGPPIVVDIPKIPVVKLPAVSVAGEYDELLTQSLGALELTPLDGVEFVDVECVDGSIVYQGDETNDVFSDVSLGYGESLNFEFDESDGSAFYRRDTNTTTTQIQTFSDGSGEFIESGPVRYTSIWVAADGSGEYYNQGSWDRLTTVTVQPDGSGVYYRSEGNNLLTVKLLEDGGGELFSETEGEKITIDARHDGTGSLFYQFDDRTVTVLVRPNGSWEVRDVDFDHSVSIIVNTDGSGQYQERGVGPALVLDFAPDGSTLGPDIVLPPRPQFTVADSFPQLGQLATIQPPCATVVRFDSELFFEFNKSDLLPEAQALLAEIAPSLRDAGRPLEINGHTDAVGPEEYNLTLSEERAQSVATELGELGVDVQMRVQGFGEAQPIAPNFNDDNSDNEVGQSQNRRVEIVIGG